jgi:hypothetical protein
MGLMHFREMVGHVGSKEKSPVVVVLVVVVNQITRLLFDLIFICFSICGLCSVSAFFNPSDNKIIFFCLFLDGRVIERVDNMQWVYGKIHQP